MDLATELRKLPKMDRLLELAEKLVEREGRAATLQALREAVEQARAVIQEGKACPREEELLAKARERLELQAQPGLRPVINATGVVIHTNLGRAPLSDDALAAMARVGQGYSNLELDLDSGERGSRYSHCAALLARLAGAEDALVVNNNAAAVMLALAALARGREAIVSRGQLVEIGGGFRIPEVMRESGAELREVGTTNRTYAKDYDDAISDRTAALLAVHRSNFQMLGFTHDATLPELAAIARVKKLVLIDDLGSGTLLDTAAYGIAHEPTVQERVEGGADLVCFSGDKLLGGPQAGFVVGRRAVIDRLKACPMLRALRVDKVTLAGIEATLRHYLRGEATARIPVWRAISASLPAIQARAEQWRRELGSGEVVASQSPIGGGSLPGMTLPTQVLALSVRSVDELARALRTGTPPVVARIEDGQLLLDPRTVLPGEDDSLVMALKRNLKQEAG